MMAVDRRTFVKTATTLGIGATIGRLSVGGTAVGGTASQFAMPATFAYEPGFSGPSFFSSGDSVTIAGSGFGTKPHGDKPLWFFPFEEDHTPDPLHSRQLVTTTPVTGTMSDAIVAPGASAATRFDLAPTAVPAPFHHPGLPFESVQLYVWTRRYYDFSFDSQPAFNLKSMRLWPPLTGQVPNFIPTGGQGTEGSNGNGNPRTTVEHVPTAGSAQVQWWGGGGANMLFDPLTWQIEELEYQNSDVETTNGIGHYIRFGRHAVDPSYRWMFRTSHSPDPYSRIIFDQKSNQSGLAEAYVYMDALYIDDSWCRVIISDEPEYQVATMSSGAPWVRREVQLPVAWSDTAITFTCRQGAHGGLSGKSLFVVTAAGTAIKVGSFGSGC